MAPAGTPPDSEPFASDVPEVGTAPFAPRRSKLPETELIEVNFSELRLPRVPGPVEPEVKAAENVDVAPSGARGGKRKSPKANKPAGAGAPKGRRRSKTAAAKTTAAKSQAKGASAKRAPAKGARKSAPAKRGPARPKPARQR
jgi:hypothetical protein